MVSAYAFGCLAILASAATAFVHHRRMDMIDGQLRGQLALPGALATGHAPAMQRALDIAFSAQANPDEPYIATMLVQDARRNDVYRSPHWPAGLHDALLPAAGASDAPDLAPTPLTTIPVDGQRWRAGVVHQAGLTIAVAVNLSAVDRKIVTNTLVFSPLVWIALLLFAPSVWYLSGRAVRPIAHLTAVVESVNARGLDQRIGKDDEDIEFIPLIDMFNDMLERLQRSFHQASRFSADAAHELKTPLAILQGELERSLQQTPPGSPLQASVGGMMEEVRRLDNIVRKLLLLSRADAGQMRVPESPADLGMLFEELIEDISLLAPNREVIAALPERVVVRGDRDLLRQVLQNLTSNAIKYGTPDGWIRISATLQAKQWWIDVANASDGIPADKREQLFERFYRVDATHMRKIDGVGLGLSLAKEIARAHGGELSLHAADPGEVCFRLQLPAMS